MSGSKFDVGDRVTIQGPSHMSEWKDLKGTVVKVKYYDDGGQWRAFIEPDDGKRPDTGKGPFWWAQRDLRLLPPIAPTVHELMETYESLGIYPKPKHMAYAAWCNNYLEDERRPCRGIVVYQEDDRDAPCTSCGGRCGYMVANYLPGQTRKPWEGAGR